MNRKSKITSEIYNKYFSREKKKYQLGGPGEKTKIYTNKAEYDKALQAYNDSLALYNSIKNIVPHKYKDDRSNYDIGYLDEKDKEYLDKTYPNNTKKLISGDSILNKEETNSYWIEESKKFDDRIYKKGNLYYNTKYGFNPVASDNIAPIGYADSYSKNVINLAGSDYDWFNIYKNPVIKPEYKESTMAKGTMESEPKPITQLMMPSGSYMSKDEFFKRYGENPWLKATGQKFSTGGNFTPYGDPSNPYGEDYTNFPTMQPQQVTQVDNPYMQPAPTTSAPNMTTSVLSQGNTSNSGMGYGKASGYAAIAAQGINAGTSNMKYNKDNMMPTDPAMDTAKSGVGSVIPFVALGSAASGALDKAASTSSPGGSAALEYVSGAADPASGWSKRNAMYKSGELNTGQALAGSALHLLSPGLDTMYYDKIHRKASAQKDRTDNLVATNQSKYDLNEGAYNNQIAYLQNSPSFKYGGNINKSVYQNGGPDVPKTKTYTDKAEYEKALQAYNDSLNLYKTGQENAAYERNRIGTNIRNFSPIADMENISSALGNFFSGSGNYKPQYSEKFVPMSAVNYGSSYGAILPIGYQSIGDANFEDFLTPQQYLDKQSIKDAAQKLHSIPTNGNHAQAKAEYDSLTKAYREKYNIDLNKDYYSDITDIYKKPVVKPEYKEKLDRQTSWMDNYSEKDIKDLFMEYGSEGPPFIPKQAKGTLEQEVRPTMAKGTMESEPKPINELMMPDGTKWSKDKFVQQYGEPQWMKATGQKFEMGGNASNVWTLVDDSNPLAYGGDMTTVYENGGTHEQNPYGGIPIGKDSLVEEGEVRFDYKDKSKNLKSYIFSNKLKYKKNG